MNATTQTRTATNATCAGRIYAVFALRATRQDSFVLIAFKHFPVSPGHRVHPLISPLPTAPITRFPPGHPSTHALSSPASPHLPPEASPYLSPTFLLRDEATPSPSTVSTTASDSASPVQTPTRNRFQDAAQQHASLQGVPTQTHAALLLADRQQQLEPTHRQGSDGNRTGNAMQQQSQSQQQTQQPQQERRPEPQQQGQSVVTASLLLETLRQSAGRGAILEELAELFSRQARISQNTTNAGNRAHEQQSIPPSTAPSPSPQPLTITTSTPAQEPPSLAQTQAPIAEPQVPPEARAPQPADPETQNTRPVLGNTNKCLFCLEDLRSAAQQELEALLCGHVHCAECIQRAVTARGVGTLRTNSS